MIWYLGIYQQCLIFGLFPDYLTFIRRLRSAIVSSHPKSEFRLQHIVIMALSFILFPNCKDKLRKLKIEKYIITRQSFHISAIGCIRIIFKILRYEGIIICLAEVATWTGRRGPGPHLEKCPRVDWSSNRTLWPGRGFTEKLDLPIASKFLPSVPEIPIVRQFLHSIPQI